VGTESKTKTIAKKAGDDVEMDVHDLLTRRLTVCEKEIHALAPDARDPDSLGEPLAHLEHARRCCRVDLG
jgi:hypothetical protein